MSCIWNQQPFSNRLGSWAICSLAITIMERCRCMQRNRSLEIHILNYRLNPTGLFVHTFGNGLPAARWGAPRRRCLDPASLRCAVSLSCCDGDARHARCTFIQSIVNAVDWVWRGVTNGPNVFLVPHYGENSYSTAHSAEWNCTMGLPARRRVEITAHPIGTGIR